LNYAHRKKVLLAPSALARFIHGFPSFNKNYFLIFFLFGGMRAIDIQLPGNTKKTEEVVAKGISLRCDQSSSVFERLGDCFVKNDSHDSSDVANIF